VHHIFTVHSSPIPIISNRLHASGFERVVLRRVAKSAIAWICPAIGHLCAPCGHRVEGGTLEVSMSALDAAISFAIQARARGPTVLREDASVVAAIGPRLTAKRPPRHRPSLPS